MRSMTKHLLWPSAALSLLAGCLLEVTPEPNPQPPPPGVVLDLEGQLLDPEGRPAQFVPVRLGARGGPIVATDETGTFVFPAVREGEHTVYAFDWFEHQVASGTYELVSQGDPPFVIQLEGCRDINDDRFENGRVVDDEILDICFSDVGLDLPPSVPDLTINQLEYANGRGDTNPFVTTTAIGFDEGEVRTVIFSMHDGLGRGGVRELTVEDRVLVDGPPGLDPGDPLFIIVMRDRHGRQAYTLRDGVFRLEIAEGNAPTRSYVLTGTDVVLDYGDPIGPIDPAYTLTVNTLRLEGTVEVLQPTPPPADDITIPASAIPFIGATYHPVYPFGPKTLELSMIGDPALNTRITINSAQLPLPGTIDVVLPIGDVPDHESDWLTMSTGWDWPFQEWQFQLVSYTLSTEMTELPSCNEQIQVTLENVVFRLVTWDYDENGDRVESFGDRTLTIDRLDIDEPVTDETPGAC